LFYALKRGWIMITYSGYYNSPFGMLRIITSDTVVLGIDFTDLKGASKEDSPVIMKETIRQLDEYFSGKRKNFSLKVELKGTDFQKSIWNAMSKIPYGKTASYKDLAVMAGKPKAARAVGGACHRNPIGIVLPCHRVIGSDGSLTGFGSGLDLKEKLLNHEKKHS
jgi:methylated-DNA-[protein]-cysteine S-methyltransferase